jgi:hypothetical protein
MLAAKYLGFHQKIEDNPVAINSWPKDAMMMESWTHSSCCFLAFSLIAYLIGELVWGAECRSVVGVIS